MKKILIPLLLLLATSVMGVVTSIVPPPGGTNGSVQFNRSGTFGGDSNLRYSTSTHILSAVGLILGSPLDLAYGGTGNDWSGVSVGALPYFSGTGVMSTLTAGTNGYILQATGAGAPIWVSSGIFSASLAIGNPISGGTVGSVFFMGAGSLLAEDNSNFFYDSTNKRLGIGTASPQGAFHVKNANSPELIIEAAATAPGLDFRVGGTSIGGVTTALGSSSNFTIRGTTGTLRLLNGSPDQGLYIPASGFVGVSNTAPSSTFTVTGTIEIKSSGWLKFADGTVQTTASAGAAGDPQVSLTTGVISGSILPLANGGTGASTLGGAFISTITNVANRIPFGASTSAWSTDSGLTYTAAGGLQVTTGTWSGFTASTVTVQYQLWIGTGTPNTNIPLLVSKASPGTGTYPVMRIVHNTTNSGRLLQFTNNGGTESGYVGTTFVANFAQFQTNANGTAGAPNFTDSNGTEGLFFPVVGSVAGTSLSFSSVEALRVTTNTVSIIIGRSGNLGAVAGEVSSSTKTSTSTGSSETDILTSTITSNTLTSVRDSLFFDGAGTFAGNINNKQVRVYLGATKILDTTALAFNGADWAIEGRCSMVGTANQKCHVRFESSSTLLPDTMDYTTPTESTTANILLKVTGTGTADSDITGEMFNVHWEPKQ